MRPSPIKGAGLFMACITITVCALSHNARTATPTPQFHQPHAFYSGGSETAPDSIHYGMSILFVGTIDADCYCDTIWGTRGGTFDAPSYLPRVIVWGRYEENGAHGRNDTAAHCKGRVPDRLKVAYTRITYPEWSNLRGSLSALQFNTEDTLSDLLIAVRGSVGEGANQHVTSRLLVVWGQCSLVTVDTIALGDVGAVQIEPFAAMELRKGSDVVNEKHRDLSGHKSYEVQRAGFREREFDTTEPEHVVAASVLRVYPNPTGIAAQVEGKSIPAGDYSVEIVAVNGEVARQQNVTVQASGSLLETLDVEQLPTGYYIVRLQQSGKPLGMFPIVVTH